MPAQKIQAIADTKIMTASGGSLIAWAVSTAEQIGPLVDLLAGIVAIGAGTMAMIWTGIQIIRYAKDKK